MARVIKVLKMQVGQYEVEGKDKPVGEWREIGVEIEHESRDGSNKWTEIKLNADILNPVLFQLVRPLMAKGTSGVWVKKMDVTRRTKEAAGEGREEGEADTEAPW